MNLNIVYGIQCNAKVYHGKHLRVIGNENKMVECLAPIHEV